MVVAELLSLLKDAGPELLTAVEELISAIKGGRDPSAAERKVEAAAARRFLEI